MYTSSLQGRTIRTHSGLTQQVTFKLEQLRVFSYSGSRHKSIVTKTKSSLPALQELPSHQEAPEAQVKATKKSGRCPKFGTFKVETKKTQETSGTGST